MAVVDPPLPAPPAPAIGVGVTVAPLPAGPRPAIPGFGIGVTVLPAIPAAGTAAFSGSSDPQPTTEENRPTPSSPEIASNVERAIGTPLC
jgi:hypothetical protein